MEMPVLVYDDDCGFCTWWAEFAVRHANLPVVGFSELDDDLRARLPADYEECAHLVTDERVYSCGAAAEEILVRSSPGGVARPPVDLLRKFGPYRAMREWGYRVGADNRDFFGRFVSRPPPARQCPRDQDGRDGSAGDE
jgi:predicted DCC family thiol-disulfide oxidoreductase YuxK